MAEQNNVRTFIYYYHNYIFPISDQCFIAGLETFVVHVSCLLVPGMSLKHDLESMQIEFFFSCELVGVKKVHQQPESFN